MIDPVFEPAFIIHLSCRSRPPVQALTSDTRLADTATNHRPPVIYTRNTPFHIPRHREMDRHYFQTTITAAELIRKINERAEHSDYGLARSPGR